MPVRDAIAPFDDVPATGINIGDRAAQPTDIEGDTLSGTDVVPQFEGNVALRRGDQFLGADRLQYDSDTQRYIAEGNIRYQDSAMRLTAERAEGNQAARPAQDRGPEVPAGLAPRQRRILGDRT